MLVVKVEIWPGGSETSSFEIARLELINVSDLAEVSDYVAHINQSGAAHLGVPSFYRQLAVSSHSRCDGPWRLIKRTLDQIL